MSSLSLRFNLAEYTPSGLTSNIRYPPTISSLNTGTKRAVPSKPSYSVASSSFLFTVKALLKSGKFCPSPDSLAACIAIPIVELL